MIVDDRCRGSRIRKRPLEGHILIRITVGFTIEFNLQQFWSIIIRFIIKVRVLILRSILRIRSFHRWGGSKNE